MKEGLKKDFGNMKERLWERVSESVSPSDKKVIQVELQDWNTEIASDSGFENLVTGS